MALTIRQKPPIKPVAIRQQNGATTAHLIPASSVGRGKYTLPSVKSVPSERLEDYTWLVYGTKKIGKTSLAAEFGDSAFFFMFEQGAKSLSVYQVPCGTWEDALGYLTELEKQKKTGTLKFNPIVIDTAFEAYQRCFEHVCEKEHIVYPREDNYGKDWKKISTEFRAFHNRILSLNCGMVVLCHDKKKGETTYTGQTFDMVIPNLPNAADDFYRAQVDNVVWYHYRGRERFLSIKGSDYAFCGVASQAHEHFLTTNGEPIFAVPMGQSAKEGYRNLCAAFSNKQAQSFKEASEQFVKKAMDESIKINIKRDAKRAKKGY